MSKTGRFFNILLSGLLAFIFIVAFHVQPVITSPDGDPSVAVVDNEIFVWGGGFANISYIYNQVSDPALLSKSGTEYTLKTSLTFNGTYNSSSTLNITTADCSKLIFGENVGLSVKGKLVVTGGYAYGSHYISGSELVNSITAEANQIVFGYPSGGRSVVFADAKFTGFNAAGSICFQNLDLDPSIVKTCTFENSRLYLSQMETVTFNGSEFSKDSFVDFFYCRDVHFYNCTFSECGNIAEPYNNAVHFDYGNHNVTVDLCKFENCCNVVTPAWPIRTRDTYDITVKNSFFNNTGEDRMHGAIFWGEENIDTDGSCRRRYIENCTFEHVKYGVVHLIDDGWIKDCTFKDCLMDAFTIYGENITVENNVFDTIDRTLVHNRPWGTTRFSRDVVVRNNQYFNVTTGGDAWLICLMFAGVHGGTVENNNFSHYGNAGFVINPNCSDITISDNDFYGAPWNWVNRDWFNPVGYDPFGQNETASSLRDGVWIWGFHSYWWDYYDPAPWKERSEVPEADEYNNIKVTGNRFDGTYLINYGQIQLCPSSEVTWSDNTISNGAILHTKCNTRMGELGEAMNFEVYHNPNNPIYNYTHEINKTTQWSMTLNSSAWMFKELNGISWKANITAGAYDPVVSVDVVEDEWHGFQLTQVQGGSIPKYAGAEYSDSEVSVYSFNGDSGANNTFTVSNFPHPGPSYVLGFEYNLTADYSNRILTLVANHSGSDTENFTVGYGVLGLGMRLEAVSGGEFASESWLAMWRLNFQVLFYETNATIQIHTNGYRPRYVKVDGQYVSDWSYDRTTRLLTVNLTSASPRDVQAIFGFSDEEMGGLAATGTGLGSVAVMHKKVKRGKEKVEEKVGKKATVFIIVALLLLLAVVLFWVLWVVLDVYVF